MTRIDPVALAQALVRLDTAGPAAQEKAAADLLAPLLTAAGFSVVSYAFAPGRPSLVAHLDHPRGGLPLVFSGHLDTVPVGPSAWTHDPFGGTLAGGMLHGRGSADMKAGVAAMVAALVEAAETHAAGRPLFLALTAAEETGCLGATHLAAHDRLPRAAGVIVAEPTDNRLAIGHRGALWLRARYAGRSAHGSLPHLGVNAIYAAAAGILRCREMRFDDDDGLLGRVSLNVGTVEGGLNVNSVPDAAAFTLDLRSVEPGSHEKLKAAVAAALGPVATLDTILDLPAVRTERGSVFALEVSRCAAAIGLDTEPTVVPYFTDGSILAGACRADVIIVGPGSPSMAHQTDEACPVAHIHAATALYSRLAVAAPP
jgi:succinyl-diaminopimelate desuccinylase